MQLSTSYIGKIVTIVMDRPMGSRHPRFDFKYLVNYGYVPDTVSGDGDELDAYVLGIDEPVNRYSGRCIAVIRRRDDDDDKLIVVPDGTEMSNAEILEQTHFVEQYFEPRIIRS